MRVCTIYFSPENLQSTMKGQATFSACDPHFMQETVSMTTVQLSYMYVKWEIFVGCKIS